MGTFRIPEDQPIENRMITRQLEGAQTRIEGFHFDARKQVLAYDDVLNKQRQVIYARRTALLTGLRPEVDAVLAEVVALVPKATEAIEAKKAEMGDEKWYELMRRLILQVTDVIWVEHLEVMGYARSSVNLRAYGQRDPLIEYRKEAKRLFEEMQTSTLVRIANIIPNIRMEVIQKEEEVLHKEQQQAQRSGGTSAMSTTTPKTRQPQVNSEPKIGRNDMVTITNGTETKEMKFKKAEPLLATGDWKLAEGK